MAGSKSNYLEAALLDHLYGSTPYTKPTHVYLGVFTTLGTPETGAGFVEPTTGAYARVDILNNGTILTRSGNVVSNASVLTFPTATADWGTIVGGAIFDAPTGGNVLHWADLGVPKTVLNGDTLSVAIGALTISEE